MGGKDMTRTTCILGRNIKGYSMGGRDMTGLIRHGHDWAHTGPIRKRLPRPDIYAMGGTETA